MIRKQLAPILFLFVFANTVLIFAYSYNGVSTSFNLKFIMVVNLMLFSMSIYNYIRLRRMDASKPSAMVRSVMVGTLLKMVIFAGAALAYATQKKAPVGYPTLLSSMGLYLIYTWIEISWTKINK
jgi:hypothetical protein